MCFFLLSSLSNVDCHLPLIHFGPGRFFFPHIRTHKHKVHFENTFRGGSICFLLSIFFLHFSSPLHQIPAFNLPARMSVTQQILHPCEFIFSRIYTSIATFTLIALDKTLLLLPKSFFPFVFFYFYFTCLNYTKSTLEMIIYEFILHKLVNTSLFCPLCSLRDRRGSKINLPLFLHLRANVSFQFAKFYLYLLALSSEKT